MGNTQFFIVHTDGTYNNHCVFLIVEASVIFFFSLRDLQISICPDEQLFSEFVTSTGQ